MSAIACPAVARLAVSAPASRSLTARKVVGGIQLRPVASAARVVASFRPQQRSSLVVCAADKDAPAELPAFVKDLMKPPDASMAAPGWLEPLLKLAEEGGESAPVVGYGIMGATSVIFALVFFLIGLGPLGLLLSLGAGGYACWQASPYLSVMSDNFEAQAPRTIDEEDSFDEDKEDDAQVAMVNEDDGRPTIKLKQTGAPRPSEDAEDDEYNNGGGNKWR
eukprot:CAMPEP_0197590934 /NCGR_PEP_ID=MMETSP1326-20131121/12308_1 /TAXON_ID=1155430 /ORGANISM="Genus nov. species nov., Strain RCC2288" /LENGTH=220 /DNA_ID=CAMNT_0043156249 /DNA_START=47 /DNA_END=710 /DNA_ORIENTATION=+